MKQRIFRKVTTIFIILNMGFCLFYKVIGIMTGDLLDDLIRSRLNPPDWLFLALWIILYILIAINASSVYSIKTKLSKLAISIYIFQLIVNIMWYIFYFPLGYLGVGLLIMIISIVANILLLIIFYNVKKTTIYLQIVYLIWLMFVGYLNLIVFISNK